MLSVKSNQSWPAGYLINPPAPMLDVEWLEAFRGMPSAIVSDCLGRNVGGLGLKPFHGARHMCGGALTVRVRPGDNLMILKAIQMARPGDVLVVDGSGDQTRAVIGGIMRAMALKAGIAGVVVNGAIRDLDEWMEGDLPVFALGCVHRGPSTDSGGEINVPISCAGLVVNPGDLVIGDSDGVVAVSPTELDTLFSRCGDLLDREARLMQSIDAGTLDPARFDDLLRSKGCPI
ncbi:TPA: RraA family protein [Pseudomonas aeruginosa]|nr:RraA family protein [Pseudomonas aeruginosa]MBX6684077.1 RraA family protein [Pseudomonas aeruginosa]HCE5853588.1 RraA family protein [Pseudomonas aeruginosa]HEP9216587.1 RraA family protein [Pseudomonas aeruginosa]HEP9248054.1 RraA family protein [Pseudomonas aeruginosa]